MSAGLAISRLSMWRFVALPLCLLLGACGAVSEPPRLSPAKLAAVRVPVTSQWPDAANYEVIVIAVKTRNRALHLKACNQKAHAAELALGTLVTLEGTLLPGKCARFVSHVFSELRDLSEAYPGENWHPMIVLVAHDPTVASQCRPHSARATFRVQRTL